MTSVIKDTAAEVARSDRAFLGHPIGLAYLAFAEAWERFSYYGMLGLLTLYLTTHLLLPGHVENVAGMAGLRDLLESMRGPLSVTAFATIRCSNGARDAAPRRSSCARATASGSCCWRCCCR